MVGVFAWTDGSIIRVVRNWGCDPCQDSPPLGRRLSAAPIGAAVLCRCALSQASLAVEDQLPDHLLFVALVEASIAGRAGAVVAKADALFETAPAQLVMGRKLGELQQLIV